MGAKRVEYQIVGRYMNGSTLTGYHLQSIETGKSGKYTKEQVCYLVGRGQVTNCTGQIYQDDVLLRGNGMSLNDLPVQYEDGDTRNMDKVGKIRRGTSVSDAMEQFMIVGRIKSGSNVVGYVIQNAGCGITKVKPAKLMSLVREGKVGNARIQHITDKETGVTSEMLRGVNCNLDELPCETIKNENDLDTKTLKYANKLLNNIKARVDVQNESVSDINKNGICYITFSCMSKSNKPINTKIAFKIEEREDKSVGLMKVSMNSVSFNTVKFTDIIDNLKKLINDVENTPNKSVSKPITNRYIILSQVSMNSTGLSVALVDFAVQNERLASTELEVELRKFINDVMNRSKHVFGNTDELLNTTINNKPGLYTYDDPCYKSINDYYKLSKLLNAKLLVGTKYTELLDDNFDSLEGPNLDKAKALLNQAIRQLV